MNSVALIIPAAGSGERLNSSIPKPYIKIAGKTILEHTLGRFIWIEDLKNVIVATSRAYREETQTILSSALPSRVDFSCVEGGEERQESIYNALKKTGDVDLVAVHDAVRPFVSAETIRKCIRKSAEVGAAIVGVPAKDTIKKLDDTQFIVDTPDRRYMWQAQTPQVFKKDILWDAYARADREDYLGTDDSSLVERLGYKVAMVRGDRNNYKITYPLDLKLARLLLEDK